jgi:hypothetical protein
MREVEVWSKRLDLKDSLPLNRLQYPVLFKSAARDLATGTDRFRLAGKPAQMWQLFWLCGVERKMHSTKACRGKGHPVIVPACLLT